MKKSLIILMFSLPLFFIAFVGCAKKEIVKEESATKQNVASEKQPGAQEANKEGAGMKGHVVKGGPATGTGGEETAKSQAATEAVKSIFKDIHFDFDKFDLKPNARVILKKQADWLLKNKDYEVRIEGNCDERGTTEYKKGVPKKQ